MDTACCVFVCLGQGSNMLAASCTPWSPASRHLCLGGRAMEYSCSVQVQAFRSARWLEAALSGDPSDSLLAAEPRAQQDAFPHKR